MTTRPRKRVAYREFSSSFSEASIDQENFKESTSLFGRLEEDALNIRWVEMKTFDEVLNYKELSDRTNVATEFDVPETIRRLYMEQISADDIRIFRPSKYPNMAKPCLSFLSKLKFVVMNNDESRENPREEGHIDDLIIDLFKTLQFDDGENMIIKCCYLNLSIAGKKFSANADREGRREMKILWVIQEIKHINDSRFKEGDVQLASCMLAACQQNYNLFATIYPKRMFGIKMKGDQLYIYCAIITESYIKALRNGLPLASEEESFIAKFPSERGLRLSNAAERKEAIRYLWSLRCYAMKLESKDDEL